MVQLYMVLDGHNGSRACDFAIKRIPSLLLQRNMGDNGERAAEVLRYAFENTEKNFFMMLDPSITRKMGLQMEMQVCMYVLHIPTYILYSGFFSSVLNFVLFVLLQLRTNIFHTNNLYAQ